MTTPEGDAFIVVLEEENELCICSFSPGTVVTAELATATIRAEAELLGGRCWPLLVRMAGMRSIDRDARMIFTQLPAGTTSSRVALLAQSPVQRVIANFFLGSLGRNVNVPTRMFTEEADARAWLAAAEER